MSTASDEILDQKMKSLMARRDQTREQAQKRLTRVAGDANDEDFQNLCFQATAADFLLRRYEQALGNTTGETLEQHREAAAAKVRETAIKLVKWKIRGGQRALPLDDEESRAFNEALQNWKNDLAKFTAIFQEPVQTHNKEIGRRSATKVMGALAISGLAVTGGALTAKVVLQKQESELPLDVPAERREELEKLQDRMAEQLDNKDAWKPEKARQTLAELEKLSARERRIIEEAAKGKPSKAQQALTATLVGGVVVALAATLGMIQVGAVVPPHDADTYFEVDGDMKSVVEFIAPMIRTYLPERSASAARG